MVEGPQTNYSNKISMSCKKRDDNIALIATFKFEILKWLLPSILDAFKNKFMTSKISC